MVLCNILAQLSKFSFQLASWALGFNSKHIRDFEELFLNHGALLVIFLLGSPKTFKMEHYVTIANG